MAKQNQEEKKGENAQYHFFYGSTEERPRMSSISSPTATNDQDSLVGESLLSTDNEEEPPTKTSTDYPNVVLMKVGEDQPLVGNTTNGNGRQRGKASAWFASLQHHHPIAYISFLVGCLSLALIILSLVLFPFHMQSGSAENPSEGSSNHRSFTVPFHHVDRTQVGDPITSFIRKDLFYDRLLSKGGNKREFVFPFPTGAFWTNLVLPATADRGLSYPVAVYPYAYKWSDDLLQVSYPAGHRKEDAKSIHDYFFPDLVFKTAEGTDRRQVRAFDPLSVTLRYKSNVGGGEAYWETYLVQGSPYVTVLYSGVSPTIEAFTQFQDFFCPRDDDGTIRLDDSGGGQRRRKLFFGVCSSETDGTATILRGIQFVAQTAENTFWLIFASEPITLIYDRRTKTTLRSDGKFKGVLRFAFLPPSSTTTNNNSQNSNQTNVELAVSSSKALQRLIYHAGVYPTGGSVSWTFRPAATSDTIHSLRTKAAVSSPTTASSHSSSTKATRIGTIKFEYKTGSFTPKSSATPSKALLMLALPHHAQSLSRSSQLSRESFNFVYKSIKGPMTPVLGSVWSYDEVLPSLGFENDNNSNDRKALKDPNVVATLIHSLQEDIQLALPTLTENVYGFGKQTARLAQLAHIARQLRGKTNSTADLKSIELEATRSLGLALEKFLKGKVSDKLVYDTRLGGIVSSDGLLNSGADFGNGRYNDHHFHYGYLLYACAVMGNLNSTFVGKFGNEVDSIFFDIAYEENQDSQLVSDIFFPAARHKMWFDGHSFANGLFPFANGKSQESSSEAVNAYYGAYLWSLVRNHAGSDPEMDTSTETDFARLLLATEIRGAKTYWHMAPPLPAKTNQTSSMSTSGSNAQPTVYSPEFAKNYMVGNLGMLDVVCSTWFGTDPVYVHLINLMPVTSITGELFSQSFASKQYAHIFEQRTEVETAWRGYVVADLAISDPNKAWGKAIDLSSPTLDSGLSKSQLLYWIATRSDFNPVNISSPSVTPSSSGSGTKSESGNCQAFAACVSAGLTGDCCPTSDGIMLGCCNSRKR